jgi:hypothetical protein
MIRGDSIHQVLFLNHHPTANFLSSGDSGGPFGRIERQEMSLSTIHEIYRFNTKDFFEEAV